MGQYAINGTIVNLPNNFEDKSPEDQKQFIDDLVQNHTDENGNLNAPNYYPNQTKTAGAEIGVASKIVQDVGLGLTHKTINLLNKAFSTKDPTAAAAAAKDPLAGTAAYHASNANIYNNEQEAARIKALHDAMSPAEKAKWEMSIDKTELVPKGTNEKIIAERQAAAKAAAEKVAAEEAAKTSSRSAMGKVVNAPGIKSILPYAGRALSGAQLVGGVDRLYQPGWRNKVSGAMNILGGGAALGSEFYPPLETVGLPLSMGLGLGAEAIAPSNETQSKKAGGLAHIKK